MIIRCAYLRTLICMQILLPQCRQLLRHERQLSTSQLEQPPPLAPTTIWALLVINQLRIPAFRQWSFHALALLLECVRSAPRTLRQRQYNSFLKAQVALWLVTLALEFHVP